MPALVSVGDIPLTVALEPALVLDEDSPSFQAMAGHGPVLFGRPDAKTAGRIARCFGSRGLTVGCTSFLAMPLIARGAVVGCATFGPPVGSGVFGPATSR